MTPSIVISVVSEGPACSFRMQSVHPCCITTQKTVAPQPRQRILQIPEGQNAPSVLRNVSVPDHLLMKVSYHFAYKRRYSIPPTEVMGNIFAPSKNLVSPRFCALGDFHSLFSMLLTELHFARTAWRSMNVGITIYDGLFYSTTLNFCIPV